MREQVEALKGRGSRAVGDALHEELVHDENTRKSLSGVETGGGGGGWEGKRP